MKKRAFMPIAILCILVLLCGCVGYHVETYSHYPSLDKTETIDRAELIVKGKVLEQTRQYFTKDKNGNSIFTGKPCSNAQVTEYLVQIDKVYKGTHSGDTVKVKCYNGVGVSAEVLLTGKKGNVTYQTGEIPDYLTVGGDCILCLILQSEGAVESLGDDTVEYVTLARLYKQENTLYRGTVYRNEIELDLETLEQDILATPAIIKQRREKLDAEIKKDLQNQAS